MTRSTNVETERSNIADDVTDALALALCHLQRGALGGLGAGGPSARVQDAIRRARDADRRPGRKP